MRPDTLPSLSRCRNDMSSEQATDTFTLYTFAMSHYSEKIRWTLDKSHIPYREVCLSPAFHMSTALRLGGRAQTTLPVLKTPEGPAIQDSPRILDWLEKNRAPLALIPAEWRTDVRAVEQRFDAIGKDVARFLYQASFGTGDLYIIKLWTDHATRLQSAIIRLFYPMIRVAFRVKLNINAKSAVRAQARIEEQINWLEQQLAIHGGDYLIGHTFTVADITAASLLAPLACPKEHPVYGDPRYQAIMTDAMAPWRHRPALNWVRRIYEKHRGQMMGGVKL